MLPEIHVFKENPNTQAKRLRQFAGNVVWKNMRFKRVLPLISTKREVAKFERKIIESSVPKSSGLRQLLLRTGTPIQGRARKCAAFLLFKHKGNRVAALNAAKEYETEIVALLGEVDVRPVREPTSHDRQTSAPVRQAFANIKNILIRTRAIITAENLPTSQGTRSRRR